jgi:cyclase
MILPRVIPALLLRGEGLVKGVRFKDFKYVGDPINAVKIFNEKEVDELFFLDISATPEGRTPPLELVQRLADECYMPFGVGGGIRSADQARNILKAGAEKVAINTAAIDDPSVITRIAEQFGKQSVVVSIDVQKKWTGGQVVYGRNGTKKTALDPVDWAVQAASLGAGEILLTSIDRDGTGEGYDLDLIRRVSAAVDVPVIACGGAASIDHLRDALRAGAAAVAAGSFFVFHGRKRAVLINFPNQAELASLSA